MKHSVERAKRGRKAVMRKLLAALLVSVFCLGGEALALNRAEQKIIAQNIRLTERSGVAKVCYDLNFGPIVRVKLVGTAGGKPLEIKTVSGDVGIVFGPQKDLCLTWEVEEDYPGGIDDEDVFLDVAIEEYRTSPDPVEAKKVGDLHTFIKCVQDKLDNYFKPEREALTDAHTEYSAYLNSDQAAAWEMMQKLKGGVPYIKRWDRDAYGKQVPVYENEPVSEREKAKIQRELDKILERAERNPDSVISTQTRRAKEKHEMLLDRLLNRLSNVCENETGVEHEDGYPLVKRQFGALLSIPEPFDFVRKGKDWED